MKIFVPADSSALSLGADEVASALIAAGAEVIRTGSRGMFWLEPLVEVETAEGRVGYPNFDPADSAALLKNELSDKSIGLVQEYDWLKKQHRVTFARVGVIEPTSVADYQAHGGLVGLQKALAMTSEQIVDEVTESGLRGRGGAGFPAGIKWKTVLTALADQKYICCNADEGDSGTFADRMLMEGDPLTLVEGMIIAGIAVGATKGLIYCRSEYPHAIEIMNVAIANAYSAGILGSSVCG
jgi:formate dehydrogenase iron-sulfur subunit